jgi:hypothetical protein
MSIKTEKNIVGKLEKVSAPRTGVNYCAPLEQLQKYYNHHLSVTVNALLDHFGHSYFGFQ